MTRSSPPRSLSLCLLFALAGVSPCHGQESVTLRTGARIRITRGGAVPAVLRTRLVLLERDFIMVRGGDVDRLSVLPTHTIMRFELSRGKNPALIYGAPVLGGSLGALLGPVLITEDIDCQRGAKSEERCAKEFPDAAVGAFFGAIAVGWLGSALAKERWQEIPLDELFLGAVPGGAIGVGVRLVF
jgi:hypothetical protein